MYKHTHVFFQQWMVLNSNFFNSLFLPQLSYPVQWIMEAVSKNVSNFLKFTSSAAADVGTSSQRMESAADVSRSLHLSKSDIYQWLVLIVLRFVEFYKNLHQIMLCLLFQNSKPPCSTYCNSSYCCFTWLHVLYNNIDRLVQYFTAQ